jgi:hypothetical protein
MMKLKAPRNCLKNGTMFGRRFGDSFCTIKRANDNRFPMPWGKNFLLGLGVLYNEMIRLDKMNNKGKK